MFKIIRRFRSAADRYPLTGHIAAEVSQAKTSQPELRGSGGCAGLKGSIQLQGLAQPERHLARGRSALRRSRSLEGAPSPEASPGVQRRQGLLLGRDSVAAADAAPRFRVTSPHLPSPLCASANPS